MVAVVSPALKDGLVSSSDTMSMLGTMGMTVSQYIVFVFSFFFLLYSVGLSSRSGKGVRHSADPWHVPQAIEPDAVHREHFDRRGDRCRHRNGPAVLQVDSVNQRQAVGRGYRTSVLFSAQSASYQRGLCRPVLADCTVFFVHVEEGHACARESGGKSQTAPKASPWLAVLAVLLIGAGYGMVLVLRFSKSLILFCCLEALFSLSSARIFSSPSSAYILCGICRRRSDFSSVEPIC